MKAFIVPALIGALGGGLLVAGLYERGVFTVPIAAAERAAESSAELGRTGTPELEANRRVVRAPIPSTRLDAHPADDVSYAELHAEAERLRARVADIEGELGIEKTMREEREGTALAKPAGLPSKYEREALLASFRKAIAAAGAPIDVSTIDCTEYPCIIVGNVEDGPGVDEFDDVLAYLNDFMEGPGFEDYRDDGSHRISVWRTPGKDGEKGESVFAVSMVPKDDEAARAEELGQRLRHRTREILEVSVPPPAERPPAKSPLSAPRPARSSVPAPVPG